MEIYPIDFVLHLINIVVLFVIVRALAYKPVRKFLKGREARIQAQLDEAAAAKADAESSKASYNEVLARADADGAAALSRARAEASAKAEEIVAAAKAEAESIRRCAEANAEVKAAETAKSVQTELAQSAVSMAERLLAGEAETRRNILQQSGELSGNAEATVYTAQKAEQPEVAEITALLEKLTGKHLSVTVKTDPALVGGFKAFADGRVYDFSYALQLDALRTGTAG